MKQRVVRYKTKPESTETDTRLILEWADDLIVNIRDFRYASYVIECAELQRVQVIGSS
jgi:hypothetical protein